MDDAVNVRLVSDVPFGAFLSGGVDSSVVVAMMTRHLAQPVKTFSIGFEDSRYDESADARRVAEHLGTEHHELIAKPDAVALLQDISWYMDEPLADSSFIPTYLVSRLAAEHVKMVLTGDGGDEMFGGYSRYVRHRQLMQLRGSGVQHVTPLLAQLARHLPSRIGDRLARVCARLRMHHPEDYLSTVALATPAAISGLMKPGPGLPGGFGRVGGYFDSDADAGSFDAILRGDVRSYLLDDILVKVDRASMANSLEARSPLLDHRLAEFAARLPEQYKLRGKTTKYLLKKVAERYVPADLVHKRKQGFAIPLAQWMRHDLSELLMDTVNSQAFAHRDVYDVAAARQLAEEHISGKRNNAETLWAILVFELWAQRYATETRTAHSEPVHELKPATG